MTFVGRILVIAIMAFAILFLGVSTVVFTTEKNWKEAKEKETKKVGELQKKLTDAQAEITGVKKSLDEAKGTHQTEMKTAQDKIAALEADIKSQSDQATKANTALGVAEQNAKIALQEATSYKEESDKLRSQKADVEKQANEYKLRQTELNDKIRELARVLDTAKKNADDLRKRNGSLSTALRSHGLSDDVSQYTALEAPPEVEGEIKRVDRMNKKVELTIGSDDGLVVGHELYLFRVKPRPEFIGKIKITSVDPDQAVGQVVGTTVQGKKIQEGDIVSSTIRR